MSTERERPKTGHNSDLEIYPWTNLLTVHPKEGHTALHQVGRKERHKEQSGGDPVIVGTRSTLEPPKKRPRHSMSFIQRRAKKEHSPVDYEKLELQRMGYNLGPEIGSGTYAKVRSCDFIRGKMQTPHPMAVKIISRSKAPQDYLTKFLPRELEILPHLQHANIIRIFSMKEIDDKTYIFMEKADGGDLLEHIKSHGAIANSVSKRMFREVVEAIRFCHNLNIVHRDLKCENVLLHQHMHVKITDFGFSRYCIDWETNKRILSNTYCGSAAYAAPEILQGIPYNPKMYDVWSMGCILFIMVCGSMPYDDSNIKKMLETQLSNKLPIPTKLLNKLDPKCIDVMRRILETDVTKRANINQIRNMEWLHIDKSSMGEAG